MYDFICRGVNMYAMLTGTLPFTVEPFSLKALHQRMVDKDMNPLPPSISSGIDRTASLRFSKDLYDHKDHIQTGTSNYYMLKISLYTPTNYVLMGIMLQKLSMNAVFVRLHLFLVQYDAFEGLIENNRDDLVPIGVLNISGDESQI